MDKIFLRRLDEINLANLKEKIKISPIGDVVGYDGRAYFIDGEKVINNHLKNGCDLMLDKNHEDREALGWFKGLELKNDGIYAFLQLNEIGQDLVDKKLFRYLSPAYNVYYTQKNMIVESLESVGLVNRPNLLNVALNNQEQGENMDKTLQEKLEDIQKENEELKKEIETLRKLIKESQENIRKERIENAIKNGELVPNRKEMALGLESNALDAFLEVSKAEAKMILGGNILELNKKSVETLDPKVAEQLGIKE